MRPIALVVLLALSVPVAVHAQLPNRQGPSRLLADTNGDRNIADAAKQTAAQAKSTVAAAVNPTTGPPTVPLVGPEQSRIPIAAAIAAGVLAILLVLVARRHGDD